MGDGIELRPWDAKLAAAMARWSERGFPYAAFDLGHLRNPRRARATLERMREATQHRHYIACEAGEPVGRVSVNLEDAAGLYLWLVHVPPEHEGRGVCRRMLASLMEAYEVSAPGRDFVLTTSAFALPAHRAYEALGFVRSETRWQFDEGISAALWKEPSLQQQVPSAVRFVNGRWEVRSYLYRRKAGTPMAIGTYEATHKP